MGEYAEDMIRQQMRNGIPDWGRKKVKRTEPRATCPTCGFHFVNDYSMRQHHRDKHGCEAENRQTGNSRSE